nr:uncharacterized protein LOC113824779 [Penaeus vannamei]
MVGIRVWGMGYHYGGYRVWAWSIIMVVLGYESIIMTGMGMDYEEHPKLKVLRDMREAGRGAFLSSHKEALDLVRGGKHVYIDDMRILDYLIQEDFKARRSKGEKDQCHFYATPLDKDKDFIFWYGYAFRKNSEYKDLFDGFFRRLSYFGILNFLHDNATASTPVCTQDNGADDRSLRNNDLFTTYVVGLVGTLAAIVAFVCEIMCRRSRRKNLPNGKNFSSNVTSQFRPIPAITHTPPNAQQTPVVGWSDGANLPPFPPRRPRTPFEVRYPDYANAPSSQRAGRMYTGGRGSPGVIQGKINETDAVWDRRTNQLILKDPSGLRKSMAVIGGVPYTFLQYVDHEGPKVQKLILRDLV